MARFIPGLMLQVGDNVNSSKVYCKYVDSFSKL